MSIHRRAGDIERTCCSPHKMAQVSRRVPCFITSTPSATSPPEDLHTSDCSSPHHPTKHRRKFPSPSCASAPNLSPPLSSLSACYLLSHKRWSSARSTILRMSLRRHRTCRQPANRARGAPSNGAHMFATSTKGVAAEPSASARCLVITPRKSSTSACHSAGPLVGVQIGTSTHSSCSRPGRQQSAYSARPKQSGPSALDTRTATVPIGLGAARSRITAAGHAAGSNPVARLPATGQGGTFGTSLCRSLKGKTDVQLELTAIFRRTFL